MAKNLILTTITLLAFLTLSTKIARASDTSSSQSTDQTLSILEDRFFEHQYASDSDTDRVIRLEQFVFGCTHTGSMTDRLQHLSATIPDETTDKLTGAMNQLPDSTGIDSKDNNQTSNNTNISSADTTQTYDQPNDSQADEAPTGKAFAYSSYPSVTSLEQELLAHTYPSDALATRLARLETKAFGTASTSNDLSQRVDNLESYAQRNDLYNSRNVAAANNAFPLAPYRNRQRQISSDNQNDTEQESPNADQNNPFKPQGQGYISKTGSFVGSIEERVSMMEAQEFGHTYPDRPLDKRLKKLESKLLPNQDDSQLGIFERTGKLWVALHPTDKTKVDNLLADNEIVDNRIVSKDEINSSSSPNSNNISTQPNTPNQNSSGSANTTLPRRYSWLSKLGNAVGSPSPYSTPDPDSTANQSFAYPYPGTYTYNGGSAPSGYRSRSYGASFGPGAGPAGLPVGFW